MLWLIRPVQLKLKLTTCIDLSWNEENTLHEIAEGKQCKYVEGPLVACLSIDKGAKWWPNDHTYAWRRFQNTNINCLVFWVYLIDHGVLRRRNETVRPALAEPNQASREVESLPVVLWNQVDHAKSKVSDDQNEEAKQYGILSSHHRNCHLMYFCWQNDRQLKRTQASRNGSHWDIILEVLFDECGKEGQNVEIHEAARYLICYDAKN